MMKRDVLIFLIVLLSFSLSSCCGVGDNYYGRIYFENPCISTDFTGRIDLTGTSDLGYVEGTGQSFAINSCGITSLIDECEKEVDLSWDKSYGSAITVEVKIWKKGETDKKPLYDRELVVKGTVSSCSSSGVKIKISSKYCDFFIF